MSRLHIVNPKESIVIRKENFIDRLRDVVLKNLRGANLTVKFLAQKMFISDRQFHRLVKKYTGKTANVYIRDLRLEEANRLLQQRQLSTKEVAFRVGYQKASWFSTQYFLKFGKRPKEC